MTRKETFARKNSFHNKMFKADNVTEKQLLASLKADFQVMKPIPKLNYFRTWFTCQSKYRKMITKSHSYLDKQLDLRKFIYNQRV